MAFIRNPFRKKSNRFSNRYSQPRYNNRRSGGYKRPIWKSRVLGIPVTTLLILGGLAYFFVAPFKTWVNSIIKKN